LVIPATNITITATSLAVNDVSEYTIKVFIPAAIPSQGAIRIFYPTNLIPLENGCRNDLIGGSTLNNTGFDCALDTSAKTLLITGFPTFPDPGFIQILFRVQNPSALGDPGSWSIETWYEVETPLNKLIS
jgi:hypothetical protein